MATSVAPTKYRTNGAIIQAFFKGNRNGMVNNLEIHNRVDSIALINYSTCIAEYEFANKTLYFNITRYSNSTSKIQHLIRTYEKYAEIKIETIKELDNQKRETWHLFQ